MSALQCEVRALFADRPSNRALVESLQRVCQRLGALYAVVHTRFGVHIMSEEWCSEDGKFSSNDRDIINQALWESVSTEEARCVRLDAGSDGLLLATIVMYDQGAEPSGGAAIVLPPCDKSRILQVMAQLEGILGYMSLLFDQRDSVGVSRTAERRELRKTNDANHPVRLAYAMLAELETRYGLELAAVGFVQNNRVQVAAVSGVDDLRPCNPGLQIIRAAMEECLDRGAVIVASSQDLSADDCRLHVQWSHNSQGNPVASLPLITVNETVAILSMSQGGGTKLTHEQVVLMQEELSGYAALVPLSQAANRSLRAHALADLKQGLRRIHDRGPVRIGTLLAAVMLFISWLAFGTLNHTFTVPCTVKATDRRTIACPRAGVLAELFVRPGDRVQEGQLLAAIDASDDFLQRAELTAEIESLSALVDQAVGDRQAGQVRVNEAKKRSLEAQLAIVDASIAQAQIRAPHDGLILEGDLRERLGSRLELGVPLFELARSDRASIELRIPERLVLAANDCIEAEFASAAEPDRTYHLDRLSIAPASTIVNERNVFLGEASVEIDLGLLPPGMEGTARIDAGPRSAWWVMSHRTTDWLYLNFWL
jgi:hypothetical protein